MKNILCIRADNMGDVIMSVPAFRALKESFGCRLTLFTSSMGSIIAPYVPFIDDVITADLPWSKNDGHLNMEDYTELVTDLRAREFDAGIIFTVYSQSSLPAAMLLYLCGIPVRVAYCRENPYALLTHWIPEKEPYSFIRHQVERDLNLTALIGAQPANDLLTLEVSLDMYRNTSKKLIAHGISPEKPFIILHAPVSEKKREYPPDQWALAGKQLAREFNMPLLLTGTISERQLTEQIAADIGHQAYNVAGLFTLGELISLITHARLLVSVNTGTVHIAAATQTPVIVLYALTNPQHTPWKVKHKILPFSIPERLQSRNEVIRYVHKHVMQNNVPFVKPEEITAAARELLMTELVTR